MEKGTLNAAFSCLEGIYTNQNVGKHVSALLQASRTSSSRFLPPYPLFPPLAPPGTPPSIHEFSRKGSQQLRVTNSSMSRTDQKPKLEHPEAIPNEGWVQGQEKFSWDGSPIAAYNPTTKMFRCIACNAMGFLSKIAEHYLGAHVNAKVFQCPECPYSSAWSHCVRLHLGKVHGIQNVPASLWRDQPLLDEIVGMLQNLKNIAESSIGTRQVVTSSGPMPEKRYMCPRCPYATDRRDLYHRHENIHKDDKPFHCYVCFKLFNRADHVKKHFLRIHKNHTYNISLIRRHPPRSSSHSASSRSVANVSSHWLPMHQDDVALKLSAGSCMRSDCGAPLANSDRCGGDCVQTWAFHSPAAAHCVRSTSHKSSSPLGPEGSTEEGKSRRGKGSGGTTPKAFACAYCPWRGIDGWCLRRHLNTHIKPFSCPFCEYKAARSERLNTHVLKVHGKHLCNKCHFAGEDSVTLERHVKEQHLSSSLNDKSRMGCSLYPPFPVRTHQMERPKIEPCGCSGTAHISCTADHKAPLGPTEQRGLADCVANEFPCRLCGCLFADGSSLETHLALAHGSLPTAPFPYRCALCGFCSFTQGTMMEHMRLHTGQTLRCRASDSRCHYSTPFEDILRDHISKEHNDENAVARCPHCGLPCSSPSSLTQHAHELHHLRHKRCAHCAVTLMRHFGVQSTSSSNVAANTDIRVQKFKQSRKQPKPRKVLSCCSGTLKSVASLQRKLMLERAKLRWQWGLYCRRCHLEGGARKGRPFRCHSSYLIHVYWCHSRRQYSCSKCSLSFRHGYQSYLHKNKHHR